MKFGNIVANLENLAEQEALSEAQEGVEAEETATEVAEGAGAADIEEAAIEKTDTAIADAEVAEDKVAELTDVAEQSLAGEGETVEEGEVGKEGEGLTEGEAAMIEITHETILSSLGMAYSRPTFTSESFKDKYSKRQATLEALEGLKATAKNIGQGIVAALKAALNTVMNFLVGLLRNRALMEKHLINLHAKLKTTEGKQKVKEVITNGAAALTVEGKASPETAFVLMNEAALLIRISENVSTALNGNLEGVMQAAQSGGKEKYRLTGGRVMTVSTDTDGVKFDIQAGEGAKEIAAPDAPTMKRLLDRALGVLKDLRKFEGTQNKLKSAVRAIIDRVAKFADDTRAKFAKKPEGEEGAVPESQGGEASEGAKAKRDARMARGVMSKVGGTFPGAAFQSVKAVADYVTGGINNYKTPGAEAGGAAPAAAAAQPAAAAAA